MLVLCRLRRLGRSWMTAVTVMAMMVVYLTLWSRTAGPYNTETSFPKYDELNGKSSWQIRREELLASGGPTKVIVLGFMRGGTSLMEQIFDHDEDAVAWYEPLSPFYGHLFGIPDNRVPSLVTNHEPGWVTNNTKFSLRDIARWEMHETTQYLSHLFACELHLMPRTFLSNQFITHTARIADYTKCYKKRTRNLTELQENPNGKATLWEYDCIRRANFTPFCDGSLTGRTWNSVQYAIENQCHLKLKAVREAYGEHRPSTADELAVMVRGKGVTLDGAQSEAFFTYERCMEVVEGIVQACSEQTQPRASCRRASLRTAKILRLRMPLFEPVIRAMPDLHIIHYFRDPRAVAMSRQDLGGPEMKRPMKRWVLETMALCHEMLLDLSAADIYREKYPGVIMTLTYEELVLDLERSLSRLYGHWGALYPTHTYTWLKSTMFSTTNQTKLYRNPFSVVRSNATALVDRWRSKVPAAYVDKVNEYPACRELLTRMNYKP